MPVGLSLLAATVALSMLDEPALAQTAARRRAGRSPRPTGPWPQAVGKELSAARNAMIEGVRTAAW